MDFNDKDVKRFVIIILVIILAILAFFLLKSLLIAIITGLILAYVFFPVYKFILKYVKGRNLAAFIVCLIVLAILIVPLWFITPILIKQLFDLFVFSTKVDIQQTISKIVPTASPEFVTQVALHIKDATSQVSSYVLNALTSQLKNIAHIVVDLFIGFFVLFYSLRDKEYLTEFANGISPLNKTQQGILVKHFKDITDSIVFGQVVIGFLQGVIAGIGLIVFGVPNALVLTVVAVILGVLPILGPPIVWIPVAIYLFAAGNPYIALGFLLYNLIFVTGLEYFLRLWIVTKRSNLPTIIVLIGMIGGVFFFGAIGFILGPLILAYFLVILKAYKEKALSSLFSTD